MCIRDRVDKDRHENRRITPSGRDVRRGNGKKEKDSDRSGAVSYTHLDVYKRQL